MARDVPLQQYDPFVKRIFWALREKFAVKENDSILVSVSGGADSVALLRSLAIIAPRRRWKLRLFVGHVNHHLRPEADDEARFVRDLARTLGIPDFSTDIDLRPRIDPIPDTPPDTSPPSIPDPAPPSSSPTKKPKNLEAGARQLRYAALARMGAAAGATYVATAHHADDQVETLLMRILRGTSIQGMGGMSWRRRMTEDRSLSLIRPMLANDHASAIRFLTDINQPWCEDKSNRDTSRIRARLRLKVLPVLKSIQPRIGPLIVAETEHFRQIGKLLDQQVLSATRFVRTDPDKTWIDRANVRDLNKAVLVGLLRGLLVQAGCHKDRVGGQGLKPILKAIADNQGGNRTFKMSGTVVVDINASSIVIRRGQSTKKIY